jgi:hypothetical protein
MQVLTATNATQGTRADDFCFALDGELVRPATTCTADRLAVPDGGCGCGCMRSFTGLSSGKATTTAVVAELDLTRDAYLAALADSSGRQGWTRLAASDALADAADELLSIASDFEAGDVLERRGDVIRPRDPES